MMQQWPYGANILIKAIDCNFDKNIILGGADFMTSLTKDTEMTFRFTEINGTLVEIETNLELLSFEREYDNEGTFTIRTNKNKNYPPKGEKPYINLCCNDVKVPLAFIDYTNSGNKFAHCEIENDTIIISDDHDDYIILPKEINVSWNKSTTTEIMIDKQNYHGDEWYVFKAQCMYKKKKEIVIDVKDLYDNSGKPKNNILVIPKLNGKENSELSYDKNIYKLKFYKYFILGVQIRIRDGYTTYKHDTLYYINSEEEEDKELNRIYDNTTIPRFVEGKHYIKSEKGFPLLDTKLSTKWNSDFFFVLENTDYYISPSTSKIYWEYDLYGSCPSDCGCDGGYCYDGIECTDEVCNSVDCPCNSLCKCNYHCLCYEDGHYYDGYWDFCTTYELCSCYEFSNLEDKRYIEYDCQGFYNCYEFFTQEYGICNEVCIIYYDWKIKGECAKGYCECNGYYCGDEEEYCSCDTHTVVCNSVCDGCNGVTDPIDPIVKKIAGIIVTSTSPVANYEDDGQGHGITYTAWIAPGTYYQGDDVSASEEEFIYYKTMEGIPEGGGVMEAKQFSEWYGTVDGTVIKVFYE